MSIEPPTDSQYGFVVCQIIRRIADAADSDDFPDVVAASGNVLFKPQVQVSKVSAPSAFAVQETVMVTLDDQGRITSPGNANLFGVWLLAGVYSVTFQLNNATLPSLTIEVTTDHTPAAPLDLVTAGSYTPPSGVTVQTLVIPSTVTTGQVLLLDDTRTLVGVPFAALDVDAAANAEASAEAARLSAQTAQQAAGTASEQAGIATGAASDAATSESNAATSAGEAESSASAAETSANAASSSATAASGSANAAALSASSASGSATAASTSAAQFNTWFLRGNGSPVGVITPASAGVQYVDLQATNGARVWISTGTTNTSWRVVDGDTGSRSLLAHLNATDWDLEVPHNSTVRRIANQIFWQISIRPKQTYTIGTNLALTTGLTWPRGFNNISGSPAFDMLLGTEGPDTARMWLFNRTEGTRVADPRIYVSGTSLEVVISAKSFVRGAGVHFTNDPWPTTLPGTPA